MRKLFIYEINGSSLKWIKSYLSNRSQKCKVKGHLSQGKQITYRVPQGSILGSLLFHIYINDPPNCLKKTASTMYADDTNITLADSDLNVLENEINNELGNLNVWLMVNKLNLNIAKTEFKLTGSHQRRRMQNNQQINTHIEGNCISQAESVESLGVFIGDKMTWKKTRGRNFQKDIFWHKCSKKT